MGRIFDAVYGYIELDDIEFKLVNSPVFQRLHWIKQLGPLNIIFPSAQHSRFSHSIGVFHIVTKIIKKLSGKINGDNEKVLRLAALLHDIGHVPISHVGERVLDDTYKPEISSDNITMFEDAPPAKVTGLFADEFRAPDAKLHECLSALIVLYDSTIDDTLKEYWPDSQSREKNKKRIAKIIVGQTEGRDDLLTPLLHSELDADRLDYLLRDSFFRWCKILSVNWCLSTVCGWVEVRRPKADEPEPSHIRNFA